MNLRCRRHNQSKKLQAQDRERNEGEGGWSQMPGVILHVIHGNAQPAQRIYLGLLIDICLSHNQYANHINMVVLRTEVKCSPAILCRRSCKDKLSLKSI